MKLKLQQENGHERDKRIFFDEEPHIYYIDGEPYNLSVTGFVHKFFKEFDNREIIYKNYDKWVKDRKVPYCDMTKDEILDSWDKNRDEAARLGTIMHRDIELCYNGVPCDKPTKEFMMFIEFFKEHTNLTPYRTEWEIYHEELGLAGSVDMLFKDKTDGKYVLCDWKRSKEIKLNAFSSRHTGPRMAEYPIHHLEDCNFIHYSLQLNTYKKILKEKYNIEVKEMFLVQIHPLNDRYMKFKCRELEPEVVQMFLKRYAGLI